MYSANHIFGSKEYSLLYSYKSNVQDYLFGHIRYSQERVLCPIYEDLDYM